MSEEPTEDIRARGPGGGTEIAVGTGAPDDGEPVAEWPEVMPVLPLKNTVLYPHILSPLLVNTQRSQALIDDVLVRPDRLMVSAAVRDPGLEGSPSAADVYRVGTVLR